MPPTQLGMSAWLSPVRKRDPSGVGGRPGGGDGGVHTVEVSGKLLGRLAGLGLQSPAWCGQSPVLALRPPGRNPLPPPGVYSCSTHRCGSLHPRRLSSSRMDGVVSPPARPRAAPGQGLGTRALVSGLLPACDSACEGVSQGAPPPGTANCFRTQVWTQPAGCTACRLRCQARGRPAGW